MNIKNNLFYYATSELSQDALLCYIMSFAMEDNKNKNKEIYNIATDLIRSMGITDEVVIVTSIKKQYKNIDVLIEVNKKYNIIIEDKTFTSQHGDQINRYKKSLIDEGRENIICVYYKIVEQPFEEEGAINIKRNDILDILTKYTTGDKIIEDYTDYLKWIDEDVNAYKTTPIKDWRVNYSNVYRGFFTHLVKEGIIDSSRLGGWSYINNKSGGVWGLWWFNIDNNIMESIGLHKDCIGDLYLQISDNQITVKISRAKDISKENIEKLTAIRWRLYHYFEDRLPKNLFQRSRFNQGQYMTVGYIEYDEKDYKHKINLMEDIMRTIENGEF